MKLVEKFLQYLKFIKIIFVGKIGEKKQTKSNKLKSNKLKSNKLKSKDNFIEINLNQSQPVNFQLFKLKKPFLSAILRNYYSLLEFFIVIFLISAF